jgi:HK97 family phage portal protein
MKWPWQTKPVIVAKSLSLTDPYADLMALFGSTPTNSGVSVTAITAMSCTAVRAAVQTIAEAVGQLPVHVFDRETKERDTEHTVGTLLNSTANEWTSASDMREILTRDALLHGDGLAAIVRVDGKTKELIRYLPGTVTITSDSFGGPVYKRGGIEIARADILHIKAPSLDGVKGEAPIKQAREAIGLAILLEAHTTRLFANGAQPGGVIEVPNALGDEGLKKMRLAWQAAHQGSDKAGKTAVLWDGAKYNPITFDPVSSQLLELRKFSIAEIGRAFSIPVTFLGDLETATWSNAEAMNRQFLQMTLLPWLKRWEGEIALKLFTAEERAQTYAEFMTDGLLRADFAARMEGYSKAIAARFLSPNEARAAENRPPYDGGGKFENPNTTAAKPANDNQPIKEAANG